MRQAIFSAYEDDFWYDYDRINSTNFVEKKRMKTLIYRYINGLNQFYRRNNDADIYVMIIVILIETFFLICLSAIFNFHLPTSDEIGNKWLVRLVLGLIFFYINRYIFGIRERVYIEYSPLSKRNTLVITLVYFAITLGFLFYSSKNQ